ncbi:MAG TPA: BTAD domain-containing putative transcriptional regulator [Candidatus Acidoferrum sp.]|nr:BTAD domain-containing putative transcriptional regulator [Candidatus Acidoferrum sp.]
MQLVLLGGFEVRAAGQEIEIPGRKERALLAFLAIPAGQARSRDKLAGLLWSDRGDTQARESLKQAVFKLRKLLDGVQPSPLRADREFVALDTEAVTVDVAEFEQLINEGTMEALARATALYRGDLLDGLDLRDPAFDEWLLMERQRLRDLAREALARLVDRHLSGGAHDQAAAAARRLLAIDPLREAAHRAVMRIYSEQGQTALALKQYQLCCDALQSELGVRPEAETERLYQSIREKRATSLRTAGQPPALRAAAEIHRPFDATTPSHDLEAGPSTAKPSIAVLPFTNLSADPEQDYFADGITEDIITQLSRLRDLLVIARNSTLVFKGRTVRVQEVARDLGVRFVLEGSVRRVGNRIRVTAQLIDAATGGHIWAERYDRELTDFFELQDEITKAVTVALQVSLTEGDTARIAAEGTRNLQAWEAFLQGHAALLTFTKLANFQARRFFERAVHHDPNYGLALVELANTHWLDARFRYTPDPTASLELAKTTLRRAEALVGETGAVLFQKGNIALMERRHDEALDFHRRAVELAPSDAYCAAVLGMTQVYIGDFQGAMVSLKTSLRLSPYGINWAIYYLVFAYLWLGDLEKARSDAALYLAREPQEPFAYLLSVIAEAAAGRSTAARDHVAALLGKHPEMTCAAFAHAQFYRDPERLRQLVAWLKDAGLPE